MSDISDVYNVLNNYIINSMDSMKENKYVIINQVENIVSVSSTSSEKVQGIDACMSGQKSKVNNIKDHGNKFESEFSDLENKLQRFKTNK